MTKPTPVERFYAKFAERPDGCWEWLAHRGHKGYGYFAPGLGANAVHAHRWSYQHHVGPIPQGMQIDHICNNRACVNPEHLRLATNKQNCEHRGGRPNNPSGYRGVSLHKRSGKWAARVKHNGRDMHLGLFDDPAEAAEVARLKRLELFTHNDQDRVAS